MIAADSPQYFTSLNTTTSYIATIDITGNTSYGQWVIRIKSQGFFDVQVLANSQLIISTHVFTSSPNGGGDIDDLKPLESKITQLTI